MKPVISAKDIEDLLAKGGDVTSLPTEAILTPSAKDLLRDVGRRGYGSTGSSAKTSGRATATSAPAKSLSSKSPKSELENRMSTTKMAPVGKKPTPIATV